MTYFDAVVDSNTMPVFNGTPTEVMVWLKENEVPCDCFRVVVGKTLRFMTVSEYKLYWEDKI